VAKEEATEGPGPGKGVDDKLPGKGNLPASEKKGKVVPTSREKRAELAQLFRFEEGQILAKKEGRRESG